MNTEGNIIKMSLYDGIYKIRICSVTSINITRCGCTASLIRYLIDFTILIAYVYDWVPLSFSQTNGMLHQTVRGRLHHGQFYSNLQNSRHNADSGSVAPPSRQYERLFEVNNSNFKLFYITCTHFDPCCHKFLLSAIKF